MKAFRDLQLFHLHGPYFYYFIVYGVKPGGLKINNRKTLIFYFAIRVCSVSQYLAGIVHDVSFHSIESLYPGFFAGLLKCGKRLYDAMIRNSNGFMPPTLKGFKQFIHVNKPVHRGHNCVQMKFNSFFG